MIKIRLAILWAAIKHLFTGKEMVLTSGAIVIASKVGITAEHWVNQHEKWKHWTVTFNGVEAVGYIDGIKV